MKFLNTIPTWVFIAAGIVLGLLIYRWYKAKKNNKPSVPGSADAFTTGLSFLLAGGKG